jgi:hypothetical protein
MDSKQNISDSSFGVGFEVFTEDTTKKTKAIDDLLLKSERCLSDENYSEAEQILLHLKEGADLETFQLIIVLQRLGFCKQSAKVLGF